MLKKFKTLKKKFKKKEESKKKKIQEIASASNLRPMTVRTLALRE